MGLKFTHTIGMPTPSTESHRKRSNGSRVHERELAKQGARASPPSASVLGTPRVHPVVSGVFAVRSGTLERSNRSGRSSGDIQQWIVERG